MILCRRPWLVYDTDALGAAAVLLLVAVGAWLVTGPGPRVWQEHRGSQAAHAAAKSGLYADLAALDDYQRGVGALQSTLTESVAAVPRFERFSAILEEIAAEVRGAELDLLSVTPQPSQREGAYLVADVHVGARGSSVNFVCFLDAFARRNPHHALRACRVQRQPASAEALCELQWTLRFYFLPGDDAVALRPEVEGSR
ncbi:MAG: hypothetical protein IPM18_16570 [Phycisphaerales bacterium]|nr:hypothetical protein [Phycisphaerales bacterium]